ncbi:MAG: class I SAM-dependent methyltransferase [Verrucomicrobiota bacterium]
MIRALLRNLHAPIYHRRVRVLAELIQQYVDDGGMVLDVGCGSGALAYLLQQNSDRLGVNIRCLGLEKMPRGDEPIRVLPYDGEAFPFADKSVDLVILADVLHHEKNPSKLLGECFRVGRKSVVIKDHKISGRFSYYRVCLLDWLANFGHRVPCLFDYFSLAEWRSFIGSTCQIKKELLDLDLYPWGLNWFFGGDLHYFVVLSLDDLKADSPD